MALMPLLNVQESSHPLKNNQIDESISHENIIILIIDSTFFKMMSIRFAQFKGIFNYA